MELNRNKKYYPKYYKYSEHKIDASKIDRRSFQIAKKLKAAGHEAYIVGGAVRDILLNRTPKDFDLVTNIAPEEVVRLFPSSYIIGRRFKLVHIRNKGHITEVSTFRSQSASIFQVIRGIFSLRSNKYFYENLYGSIEDDFTRRDITINALYYDPVSAKLIDFAGGYDDIKQRRINVVGIPSQKFDEDPMRMLRIIRFAAKLDFTIRDELTEDIDAAKDKINSLPDSRVLEEFNKFFLNGHAYKSYKLLIKHDCLKYLIADDWHNISQSDNEMLCSALQDSDRRYAAQQYLAVVFSLALFLWPKYNREMHKLCNPATIKFNRLRTNHRKVCSLIFSEQKGTMAIPVKLAVRLEKIWLLQYQMQTFMDKSQQKFKENSHFKMAYDLLKIRTTVDSELQKVCDYWQKHAEQSSKFSANKRNNRGHRRPRRSGPKNPR